MRQPFFSTAFVLLSLSSLAFTGEALAVDCVSGSAALDSQAEIDAFQTNFGPCDTMTGGLTVRESAPGNITNLNGLSGITSIGGFLAVQANMALTNLDGLSALTSVADFLGIFPISPSQTSTDSLESPAWAAQLTSTSTRH